MVKLSREQYRAMVVTLNAQGYVMTHSIVDDTSTGGVFFLHPGGAQAVIRQGRIEYLGRS